MVGYLTELLRCLGEKGSLVLEGTISASASGTLDLSLSADEICVISSVATSFAKIGNAELWKGDIQNAEREKIIKHARTTADWYFAYETFDWFTPMERFRVKVNNTDTAQGSVVIVIEYVILKQRVWDLFFDKLSEAFNLDFRRG